jgi:hypothetical protein
MSFVIFAKYLLEKHGDIKSLDQHLSFNEYELLQTNEDYLRYALEIEQINIHLIDPSESDAKVLTNFEDILPGKPVIYYRYEKSIIIRLINRQSYSPNFEWSLPVMNGDTIKTLERHLRQHAEQQLKLCKNIRLFYFENWQVQALFDDLVVFENKQEILKIDMQYETLVFEEQNIGNTLVYFVE